MKLSNKIALISSVGCLALIGTGFAAWTFTNTVNDSADATAKVTCAIEAEDVKVYNGAAEIESFYIFFDAPTTAAGTRKAGEGIFYASDEAGAKKITSLTLKGTITHEQEDVHYGDGSNKVEFKVTETDQLAATNYVTFAAGSLANDVQNVVSGTDTYEATYTLPTYTYVDAQLPTDVAGVTAMKTAMAGKKLSLAFTFGIQA